MLKSDGNKIIYENQLLLMSKLSERWGGGALAMLTPVKVYKSLLNIRGGKKKEDIKTKEWHALERVPENNTSK